MIILIVEDEAPVLKVLQDQIRAVTRGRKDIVVVSKASLADALEWLLENKPDAVLSNGFFPRGTVTERTLRNLRETQHWALIWPLAATEGRRFVLLSGDSNLVVQARAIGVPAFLKPEGVRAALRHIFEAPAR